MLKLEEALRSIVPDVTMPYWDETSAESLEKGIPAILTQEKFELDGERSFVLPVALTDELGSLVIRGFATVKDPKGATKEYYLGHDSVLSRRNVVRCANCLTHLEVVAHFPLDSIPASVENTVRYCLPHQKPCGTDHLHDHHAIR